MSREGSSRVAQDDELLVVRPGGAHPHVSKALPAGLLDLEAEVAGLVGVEAQPPPVRAPQQTSHVDTTTCGGGEGGGHGGLRVVGQPLVRVPAPVDEEQEVTLPHRADALVELSEVGTAVDHRADVVAHAPRRAVLEVCVDAGVRVLALLGDEEEVGQHGVILPARGASRQVFEQTEPQRTKVGRVGTDRAVRGLAGPSTTLEEDP